MWRKNNPEKAKDLDRRMYDKKKDDPEFIAYNRAKSKKWAEDNPERYKESQAKWKQDIIKVILGRVKNRAKKRNLEFNLDERDIFIPETCPVFGTPLIFNHENNDYWPAVDRLDNSRGYVKGNVNVMSYRANRIKSDASLEELRALVKYLEEFEDTLT